jgi:hypothetical protein
MQIPANFSLEPSGTAPEAITVTRANGERLTLDPRAAQPKLSEEHAPLEQMEEDWGAVCEVFRQRRDLFLRLRGVQLARGDQVTMRYPGGGQTVLRVVEMEGALARVEEGLESGLSNDV